MLIVGIILVGGTQEKTESIKEIMRDAVLHENDRINVFGIFNANPGLVAAFAVTAITLVFSLIVRIFVIPKFKNKPKGFQLVLEMCVGYFDKLSKSNSPHRNKFLGAYVFAAGYYIFVSTMLEMLGLQAVSANGASVSLPAPLSDINGAIVMGVFSYGVILIGGLVGNGFKGFANALKDFSLPISMSFRLFGALLSGALVTELVYYYTAMNYVVPIIVGVMFTILHAVIQAYVLTMLVALFYGESNEKKEKRVKA